MQLRVIQDSDNLGIGKLGRIDAQVGMELANGYTVVKVNEKSIIAEHNGYKEKFFPITSIYYTEAICWGFTDSVFNHQAEKKAAIARNFERGEAICGQHYEQNITLSLEDAAKRAGYEFAKKMQVQRELAIAALLTAETALSKQEVQMSEDQQCKVNKRLDLKIQELGLAELLAEQDSSAASYFCYKLINLKKV